MSSFRPRWFAWAGLLAVLIAVPACEGSAGRRVDGGVDGSALPDTAAPVATLPLLGCTENERGPGLTAACGDLRVPERYENEAGPTVLVRVARYAPLGHDGGVPIVYLDGGAGGSSIANAAYYAAWSPDHSLKLLLAGRPIIAIDLRGAGGSRPLLACEGVGVEPLSADSETGALTAAVAACRQSLLDAGVHLDAYGSAAAARDVEAAIGAMGLARYDLVAVGHGARVALELVRRGAPGLRALVLDSATPPDADALAEEGPNRARALEAVYAACEATPACAPGAPALRTALAEIAARLTADPADVATHGGTVTLDGRAFLQAVTMSLREGDPEGLLPRHIADARKGELGFFAAVLGAPRGRGSVGAHLGVLCAEDMAFTSAEAIEAAASQLARPLSEALTARYYTHACPVWALPRGPAGLHAPLAGVKLPVLVLSGALDPGQSATGPLRLASGFTGGQSVIVPGHGSAVVHRVCGGRLVAAFLDQPSLPVSVAAGCATPD